MTTSQIDAAAWPQAAETASTNTSAASDGPSWGVALIGVGAILTIGWVGLIAFIAARLSIF